MTASMSTQDDREWGPSELTGEERRRVAKAKKDHRSIQLGCLAMLLVIAVLWLAVAHLFEWAMGWKDSWW